MWAGTPTTVELGGTSDSTHGAGAYAGVFAHGNVAQNIGVVADEDAVATVGWRLPWPLPVPPKVTP